jgi:chromosome segregation ATPase
MNDEVKQDATQEVVQAAQPEGQTQAVQPQGAGENAPDPQAVLKELEEVRKKAEALERELRKTREEAASRRVEKKSLEERIQEMEAALNAMRERAALEAARAELVAAFGDKGVAEAALKLAKADGLLRVEGEQVQVDLESLFQRYPILRVRRAPQDTGANPPSAPRPTTLEDAVNEKLFGRR